MFGRNLGVDVILCPSGKYAFVGTIPVECAWVNKDGTELNQEQADKVCQAPMPGMIAKRRVFETEEAAWQFYNELMAARDE